jgi:glycosyltransferase involved in cell wall biosynthesis
MKEVWILNHYAQEPGNGGGTRHYSLAKNITAFGWRISLIAASVELNTGRQRLEPNELNRLDFINQIPFLWVKTPTYQGNGLGRMWNMLVYAWRTLQPYTTRGLARPDIVIGSSVHPFAAFSAALISRRLNVPFVFEVRDLWPQTLIDLGRISERSILTYVLKSLELWLYRNSKCIIVLLPHADEYIKPLGVPSEKIVWIPNGVDLDTFSHYPILNNNSVFTFMYFGAHGEANGLSDLLKGFKLALNRNGGKKLCLRLIGDGPLKNSLVTQAKDLKIDSAVYFEPPIPKEDIPKIAAEADSFIFNLIDAPVFKYGISSNKLFDFMAASRPIIFCCSSKNNPVADAGAGITVAPGDHESLASAMRQMADCPLDVRQVMGENGRRYVTQNHNFSDLACRLSRVLGEVLEQSKKINI